MLSIGEGTDASGFGRLLELLKQKNPLLAERLASLGLGAPRYGEVEAGRLPSPVSLLATPTTAVGGYSPGDIAGLPGEVVGSPPVSPGDVGGGLVGAPLGIMAPKGEMVKGIIQRLLEQLELERGRKEQGLGIGGERFEPRATYGKGPESYTA